MRILVRNTVFKTAVLAGLFLCMLMLAGAFSGITTSVHAITANEVGTEEELKQFVEEAVDEYYVNTLIREHCDFSQIAKLAPFQSQIPDLSTLTVDGIKNLIPLFGSLSLTRADIDEGCDFTHRFDEVFGRGEGDWKSGSIYLFVMDDNGNMLFHGADQNVEGERVVAVDEGERNVRELILAEAATPGTSTSTPGIVQYCWDDPTTESDNIDDNDPATAPGDSWKISYVVNPFAYLGAPELAGSPGIIFGSGIYPKTGTPPSGCDGNGMADGGEEMMEEMMEEEMEEQMEEQMEEEMEEEMEEVEVVEDAFDEVGDSISGGGCAIAAGSDSTPRNNGFNLLLIVSALFLAVSFGNREVGRRNDIRS